MPYFKSDGVTFDLTPKITKVTIGHGAVDVTVSVFDMFLKAKDDL